MDNSKTERQTVRDPHSSFYGSDAFGQNEESKTKVDRIRQQVQARLKRIQDNQQQAVSSFSAAQQEGLRAQQIKESLSVVNAILRSRTRQTENHLVRTLRDVISSKLL